MKRLRSSCTAVSGYGTTSLVLWLCLCSLASWSQPAPLHFSESTWNGYPPVFTRASGTILISEDEGSIAIQGRNWKQTYRIVRRIMSEGGVTVYGCEARFRNGRVSYVIKHEATRRTLTLYPHNKYLKASTTFWLNPP
ncbi:hypothetical protein [Pontibacter pamirensis]|uniref:hypothetical protein n=1 Tax=Pontibacter pamirensis TaxID=2562824 RepID=UPI00138943B5|nr:hypothetical protein [Pontibacter pamirensis]